MKSLIRLAALLATFASFSIPIVLADDGPVLDIQKIDCRTMLKMDDDEQDFTLIYFHGFMSGKKGELMFDGPALLDVTDKIMDACIDHPAMTLMEVFTANR